MRTSQNGINLIKQLEGCRLKAYKCAAGVWTIGYGHTAGVQEGQVITQVQAESFLKDDLAKYEAKVMKYNDKYRWNQNEFDALVSFAYNIGSIEQLTAGGTRSLEVIAGKMLLYNKAGGKALAGLTARRKKERELFLTPVTASASGTVQAASVEPEHTQLNYQPGEKYQIAATGLRVRTKKASQSPDVLPNGEILRTIPKGTIITNQATAAVGNSIWMYFGLDSKGREQWICADTGLNAYVG